MTRDRLFRLLYRVIHRVFLRTRVSGLHLLPPEGPAILVANHTGSYGPIAIMCSLPLKLIPWVIHAVTDPQLCAEYIRQDFTEKELRLRPPWSGRVSRLIAIACVALMRAIGAIPVYARSRRIRETYRRSLRRLRAGYRLIIFPETGDGEGPRSFDPGFVSLARLYARQAHRPVPIYPVAVSRAARTLQVGRPVQLDPRAPFSEERRRVKDELEEGIRRVVRDMEDSARLKRAGPRAG